MPDDGDDLLDQLERDYLEEREQDFQEKRKREQDFSPEKRKNDFEPSDPFAPTKVTVYKSRRGCGRFTLIGGCLLLIVAILLCVGAIVGGVFLLLKPASAAASGFMHAMRDEEYDAAYNMLAADTQDEVGSAESFRRDIEEHGLKPASWSINNWNVNGNTGYVSGTVRLGRDDAQNLIIYLIDQDGWKISDFSFGQQSYP